MKVSTEKKPRPAFEPVKFWVTIETEDELRALWNRLDVGLTYLRKRYASESRPLVAFPDAAYERDLTEELFREVDSICIERGLRSGGRVGHE